MNGLIYKYTSPSGKAYIGQTTNPKIRKYSHSAACDPHSAFHKAILKYGYKSFIYEILADGITSPEELDEAERQAITKHNTLAPNGYNLTAGGQYKTIMSAETRLKCSLAQKGRKHNQDTKRKMSESAKKLYKERPDLLEKRLVCHAGWKHKPEALQKMSIAKKGKTLNPIHRQKIINALRRVSVNQFSLDGQLLKTWPSIVEAASSLAMPATHITRVCKGRRKSAHGFKWSYV